MPAVDLRKLPFQPGSRVAIFGPPNTLKTTAMLTWPKPEGFMLYPGEKGWDTIPRDREDIIPLIWQIEDPAKVSPHQIVKEVETTTWRMLAGEYGKIEAFAGDGLHKLYGWYYRRAHFDLVQAAESKAKGSSVDPEDFRGAAYGRAHDDFGHYVTRVLHSSLPWIVMSLWEDRVKDNPDDASKRAPRHIFPDLPGQMAKNIVGEFSCVLYSEVSKPDPQGRIRGAWQTKAAGDVWGVGCKVPVEIALKIPSKIPQTFEALMKALRGEPIS